MKINLNTSAKLKTYLRFYGWPWALSTLLTVFMWPISQALSISPLWILPLETLIWIPFLLADYRRVSKTAQQAKLRLQAKHDAEDKAMFGDTF